MSHTGSCLDNNWKNIIKQEEKVLVVFRRYKYGGTKEPDGTFG